MAISVRDTSPITGDFTPSAQIIEDRSGRTGPLNSTDGTVQVTNLFNEQSSCLDSRAKAAHSSNGAACIVVLPHWWDPSIRELRTSRISNSTERHRHHQSLERAARFSWSSGRKNRVLQARIVHEILAIRLRSIALAVCCAPRCGSSLDSPNAGLAIQISRVAASPASLSRFSDTGTAVRRACANRDTRYSSIRYRNCVQFGDQAIPGPSRSRSACSLFK